jgi:hypothetical protein
MAGSGESAQLETADNKAAGHSGSKLTRRFFLGTYGVANLGLVLYGVSVLAAPELLLASFSSHVYRFPADATVATAYLAALFRLLGYFNFVLGVVGLLLLRALITKRRLWTQRLVITSTLLAYLGPVIFDNTVGHIGPAEIAEHVIFGLVILSGILMWRSQYK